MRVLLVEDNLGLSDWISRILRSGNYTVDCAHNGADADHVLHTQSYDLVILDLSLPKLSGQQVLKRLRARGSDASVLILTASGALADRVEGLNAGADDYIAKPFEVTELEARIRAILRRANHQKNPLLQCGALCYDGNTRLFMTGKEQLSLTPREHAVLEALMMKMGKTVSKKGLADSVFAMNDEAAPEAIEVYVHRLRKKLEHVDAAIITLRGLGYLLKQRYAA